MQIPAPKELSAFIKHYLFLEVSGAKDYSLFANGNCGLTFSSNSITYRVGNEKVQADASVFGQITNYLDLHILEKTQFFVIVFQPYGLNKLTRIPGKYFKDLVSNANDVFKNQLDPIREIIKNASSRSKLIQSINNYFYCTYLQKQERMDQLVPSIVNNIIATRGSISLHDIKEHYAIHERKLQRLFMEQVGVSPKKFLKVVKLHAFIGLLNEHKKLTHAVYKAGYYDQSHLIRDFKTMTGMTPGEYLKATTLAVNLVERV